jgi:hypothetical protein
MKPWGVEENARLPASFQNPNAITLMSRRAVELSREEEIKKEKVRLSERRGDEARQAERARIVPG